MNAIRASLPTHDFTEIFSAEISLEIFSRLSLSTLSVCQQVSKTWYALTSDPVLWKQIWETKTGRLTNQKGNWKVKLLAMERLGKEKPSVYCYSSPPKVDCIGQWKEYLVMKTQLSGFYFYHFANLRLAGFIKCSLACTEMVFYKNQMITLHLSNAIWIWDLTKRKLKKILPDFGSNLCVDGKRIFSQHLNQVHEWDLDTFEIKASYKLARALHGRLSLGTVRGNLMGFYEDALILVYDQSSKTFFSLHGHHSWVYKIEIIGDYLISSSNDCTIKIWDLQTQKCCQTLCHSEEVYSFTITDGKIYAYTFDKKLYCWDFLKQN